jgi:cytochrome c peroxidase
MKKLTMTTLMLFAAMAMTGNHAVAAKRSPAKKSPPAIQSVPPSEKQPPPADRAPSIQEGEMLFRDSALGGPGNTQSCSSCHPMGKGLDKAWRNPDLAGQVNKCISATLKGKPLPPDSIEMKSLILYIKSFKPVPASSIYGY